MTDADVHRHQKKALTFMKQREDTWSFEDSPDSLWVKEVDDTGELMFVIFSTYPISLTLTDTPTLLRNGLKETSLPNLEAAFWPIRWDLGRHCP